MEETYKVTWKGWLSLFLLALCFSGLAASDEGPVHALDLMALIGKFGTGENGAVALIGKGGYGAREGFLIGLSMIPTLMLAQGLVEVAEHMGALLAAGKVFRPLLKGLLGIPGVCGLAFVSSFTSSDIGAVLTKEMYDKGQITDGERTVFASYQYAGSAVINNTIGSGAALLPISLLPVGVVILLILAVKIIGANLVRLYVKRYEARLHTSS